MSDRRDDVEASVEELLERVIADARAFLELPLEDVEPAIDFSAAWGPDD